VGGVGLRLCSRIEDRLLNREYLPRTFGNLGAWSQVGCVRASNDCVLALDLVLFGLRRPKTNCSASVSTVPIQRVTPRSFRGHPVVSIQR
jgi:hypothetical protein